MGELISTQYKSISGIPRQKSLLKLLDDLELLYTDLNSLIIGYDTVHWEGKQVQEIKIDSEPWKMVTDQKHLYICTMNIERYTVDSLKLVDNFTLGAQPYAIDLSGNELYVYERGAQVKVFNILTKEIIRQWKPTGHSTAIKLNDGNLYFANYFDHDIIVYNLSGDLIKQFGKLGSGPSEFDAPVGMDIDDQFIYITEYGNHRVQIFHLVSCTYSHQWGRQGDANGEFTCPYEIRLHEGLCYVGDAHGVQVITKDGQFLFRFGKSTSGSEIGEFRDIRGILVIGNQLYVSDSSNRRLVVLQ